MGNKTIALGIVTHNRYELLKKCIESVLIQDYKNVEIFVLDDASTDDTSDIVIQYPSIKYSKSEKRAGQAIGRNFLMRTANAEYFINLDDDAYFMSSNIIDKAVDYMNRNENIAILGFDILSPLNSNSQFKMNVPFPQASFIGCGNIMRLNAIKKVDYYSPSWGWAEEEDLSIKIHESGFDIFAYPGLFVWHEITQIARNIDFQWRSQVNNVLSIVVRYYPTLLVFPVLIYKAFSLFRFSLKKKLIKVYWNGVYDFLRELEILIRNRKPVKFATIKKYHKLLSLNKHIE